MRLHRGLVKVALMVLAAAVASGVLAYQMTDSVHFGMFILMTLTLIIGALYVLWNAREPG